MVRRCFDAAKPTSTESRFIVGVFAAAIAEACGIARAVSCNVGVVAAAALRRRIGRARQGQMSAYSAPVVKKNSHLRL
jgi:hypothetical protein